MSASGAVVNTRWARAITDELARSGVREIAVAPGSRSTPLVMALAVDGRFRLRVHLDERSAAFFALGVGKVSGTPAAVLTTSGTAVANLLPAVVESAQAETPLLVLTADRPPRLRGADANQAIDQAGIFGSFVRASFDLAVPTGDDPALRHMRTCVSRAVGAAAGHPMGPVHLNVPFDKPLEPVEEPVDVSPAPDRDPLAVSGRPDGRPYTTIVRAARIPAGPELDDLVRRLNTPRGMIVAGPVPEPDRVGPEVRRLARATGFPLLADPLSGARFGSDAAAGSEVDAVAGYDLFLRAPEVRAALRPSFVLRVGQSPTSAVLTEWLVEQRDVPSLVVDGGARWKDHGAGATDYLITDLADTMRALAERVHAAASTEWADRWVALDRAARGALDDDGTRLHEGAVWPELARALPEALVFVSSSMPIRDLDAFAVPSDRRWRVYGNRGASGIDGIVSTAFGAAAAGGRTVLCVLGDLALFHDQNGLLWSREPDLAVVFLLVDNDGGGIFHMLPIVEHEPEFTTYFATPHGLDFRHAAALHGIELRDVTMDGLAREVAAAEAARRTVVLRLRTDREQNRTRRAELTDEVVRRARAALG